MWNPYNLNEKRIFVPKRTDDLEPECLPWIGKQVTVRSWHSNLIFDKYPDDERVGYILEFKHDVPESELLITKERQTMTLPTKAEALGQLTVAKNSLLLALTHEYEANDSLAIETRNLKKSQYAILISVADPKELGSNEAQRAATIADRTAVQQELVDKTEITLRGSRYLAEIARIDHQFARDTCKLIVGAEEL